MAIKDFFKFTRNTKQVTENSGFPEFKWTSEAAEHFVNAAKSFAQMKNSAWGLQNPALGIGGAQDSTAYNYQTPPPSFDFQTMDNLYRTNLFARKIIDIPAEDMTRKWREFEYEDPEIIEKRTRAERTFKIKDRVKDAVRYADLYGGAGLLMVVDDGKPDNEELIIQDIKPGQLKKFQPVFLGQMYPSQLTQMNPSSPYFRRPMYYNIANNTNAQVHQSRLIIFDGIELPLYAALSQMGFGDSALTACREILEATQMTYLNIANLIGKANIDVIAMKDFMQLAASSPNMISNRMTIQQQLMSNLKQLVIDAEDSFERNELSNIAGLSELLMSFLQMTASAGRIPLTKFLGTSVAGFGTGENEVIEYYDNIHSRQSNLDPQLRILDEVMERNLFGDLIGIDYEWITLHEPEASQRTSMELQRMQTDIGYIDAGVLTPKIAAERLRKEGKYDGITPEYIQELEDSPISAEEEQDYESLMQELSKGDSNDQSEQQEEPKDKDDASNSRKSKRSGKVSKASSGVHEKA